MVIWIFNIWLYFMSLSNPVAYQNAVAAGIQPYSCVDLSSRQISNACTQPMPKMP